MTDNTRQAQYIVVMKNGHTFTVTADFDVLMRDFQDMIKHGAKTIYYFGKDVFVNIDDISVIHRVQDII